MGAIRVPDQNNQEQLLEYGVLTVTAPDGTKMGAKAMTLTGSNLTLDEVIAANAVAIRDTVTRYFPGGGTDYGTATRIDTRVYADRGFHIFNGHDQAVNVLIYGDVSSAGFNGNFAVVVSEVLAAGAKKWYGRGGYASMGGGEPVPYMVVQINATVIPTTGAITIKFEGGRR